jgi:iron complex outermembrane recepter protein
MTANYKARLLTSAITRAFASGWATQTLAQSPLSTDLSSPTIENSESEPVGLGEIVVTAERRSENLQRAAISITSINSEQLARASIGQL